MTTDHLSLTELAELDEGLLPPERTSAVRAHLHDCEQCRARAEAISTARSALADLPATTMPRDVEVRLSAAIAAERSTPEPVLAAVPPPRSEEPAGTSHIVTPEDHDEPERSETVTPAPGSVSRPRFGRPTLAASAAAASVALALGAIVVAHYHHGSSTPPQTAAASGAGSGGSSNGSVISPAQPRNFVQSATGRVYTLSSLAPDVQSLIVAAPAATTGHPDAAGSTAATAGSAGSGAAAKGRPPDSKRGRQTVDKPGKRTGRTLDSEVPSPATTPSLLPDQPIPAALQPLARSRAKILACAAVLAGQGNAVPLAVDFGRWTNPPQFNRSPAAVFIFKGGNPSNVAVYVVGPACDGTIDQFSVVPLPS